jgi:hypothetical protein
MQGAGARADMMLLASMCYAVLTFLFGCTQLSNSTSSLLS